MLTAFVMAPYPTLPEGVSDIRIGRWPSRTADEVGCRLDAYHGIQPISVVERCLSHAVGNLNVRQTVGDSFAQAPMLGITLFLVSCAGQPVRTQSRCRIHFDRMDAFKAFLVPGKWDCTADPVSQGIQLSQCRASGTCDAVRAHIERLPACLLLDMMISGSAEDLVWTLSDRLAGRVISERFAQRNGPPRGASRATKASRTSWSDNHLATVFQGSMIPARTSQTVATPRLSSNSARATPTSLGFVAQSTPTKCIPRPCQAWRGFSRASRSACLIRRINSVRARGSRACPRGLQR